MSRGAACAFVGHIITTGDIRMVLADSNGHQITKDNFGTLKAQ